MVSLARGGQAKGSESVYFVTAHSAAPVARKGRSLRPRCCALLQVTALFLVFTRKESRARVVRIGTRVLVSMSSRAHVRMRARALVARVRHGDALWVCEHAVMYTREIHHNALEVG